MHHPLYKSSIARISAAVFALVLLPYFVPLLSDTEMSWYGDLYADMPLILVICLVCLIRRRVDEPPQARRFWRWIGLGFGAWFLARIVYLTFPGSDLASNLVSDFSYWLLYLSLLVAIESFPGDVELSPCDRALCRLTLAGGIVMLAAAYLYLALTPAVFLQEQYINTWLPSSLLSLGLDSYICLRFIGLRKRTTNPYWRNGLAWLAGAFAWWVLVEVFAITHDMWGVPDWEVGSLFDAIWLAPFAVALIGVAWGSMSGAIGPRRPMEQKTDEADPSTITVWTSPLIAYAFALPATHLALYAPGLLDAELRRPREILVLVTIVVLAALIVRFQRLVLEENQRLEQQREETADSLRELNLVLEDRVRKRTAELEALNRRLEQDIDRREQIELQLRAAEVRNRALIRAIPDTLFRVDRLGVVQEVKPHAGGDAAASDGADHDQDDAASPVGATFLGLLPASIVEVAQTALRRVQLSGKEEAFAYSERGSGGDERQIEMRIVASGVSEVLAMKRDVTEAKQVEMAMQRAQKIESLGVLAGGIAHDFNNLLVGILGEAQLALSRSDINDEAVAALTAIESSGKRAALLTDKMLAYAGRVKTEPVALDFVRLLDELRPLLLAAIDKKTELIFETASDLPAIAGDEAQLTQVVLNLVLNAAEAIGSGGGRIMLKVDTVTVETDDLPFPYLGESPAPGRYLNLRVEDEGCGIDPTIQGRVFEPFFSTKDSGHGLGLAAVLGIIKGHEGAIYLDSAPGTGTRVSVLLPVCSVSVTGDVDAEIDLVNWMSSGTILIADDESIVSELMATYLERHGFDVLVTENGKDAVACFRENNHEIVAVMLDLSMPVMNGIEAFTAIRELNEDTPVFLLSGYGEKAALADLDDSSLAGFISKPFELNVLARALLEHVPARTMSVAHGAASPQPAAASHPGHADRRS